MSIAPPAPPNKENISPEKDGVNTEDKKERPQKRPIFFVKGSGDNSQLVIATYILGAATLALAYFAFDQAGSIRNTFREQGRYDSIQLAFARTTDSVQRDFDAAQIHRLDAQLANAQSVANDQRKVARTQLDSFHTQLNISREVMERQWFP